MRHLTQTCKTILTGALLMLMCSLGTVALAQPAFAASTPAPSSKFTDPAASSSKCGTVSNCDLITQFIDPFIAFLSAAVGVAVVASIIVGGIQYSSSGGDPSKVAGAKARIRNALIALVTYLFLLTLLNFLIPGGIQ